MALLGWGDINADSIRQKFFALHAEYVPFMEYFHTNQLHPLSALNTHGEILRAHPAYMTTSTYNDICSGAFPRYGIRKTDEKMSCLVDEMSHNPIKGSPYCQWQFMLRVKYAPPLFFELHAETSITV